MSKVFGDRYGHPDNKIIEDSAEKHLPCLDYDEAMNWYKTSRSSSSAVAPCCKHAGNHTDRYPDHTNHDANVDPRAVIPRVHRRSRKSMTVSVVWRQQQSRWATRDV
jgi:hypothetical protein